MNSQEPISSPLSPTASDVEDIPFVPPSMSIEVTSKVSPSVRNHLELVMLYQRYMYCFMLWIIIQNVSAKIKSNIKI
jgi:hypothetical protein